MHMREEYACTRHAHICASGLPRLLSHARLHTPLCLFCVALLAARSGTCKIENILDKTCEEMQQTINQSLQNNLNKLEKDCKRVDERIGELLTIDEKARAKNRRAAYYGWIAFFTSLLAPFVLLLLLLHRSGIVLTLVELLPGAIPTEVTTPIVAAFGQTCDALVAPETSTTAVAAAGSSESGSGSGGGGLLNLQQLLYGCAAFFVALQIVSRLFRRYEPALTGRELNNLLGTRRHVHSLLKLKETLYKTYLDQCRSEIDNLGAM